MAPTDDATNTDSLAKSRRYTTISIPQPLYKEIKRAIQGTGFRSPTEYLVYVTRTSLQRPLPEVEQRNVPAWTPILPRSPHRARG